MSWFQADQSLKSMKNRHGMPCRAALNARSIPASSRQRNTGLRMLSVAIRATVGETAFPEPR
jgi:hypothetical protein